MDPTIAYEKWAVEGGRILGCQESQTKLGHETAKDLIYSITAMSFHDRGVEP
jgi:hypothetical protein